MTHCQPDPPNRETRDEGRGDPDCISAKPGVDLQRVGQDGIPLAARVVGDGPRTLLCLPGLARTAADFDGLAALLPAGWRAVCPDHRGRGASGRDPRPRRYHTATYARDAGEWLDHLDIGQAVVLGSSFGGWVALALAASQPERVSGVILNDIGATVPRAAALQYMQRMGRRTTPDSVDPAFNRQMRRAHRAAPLLGLLIRLGFMRHSAPIVRGYEREVRGLHAPLLVLRGGRSRVLTDKGIHELRGLQPALSVATIEGVGHTPTLTETGSVTAIRAFLTAVIQTEMAARQAPKEGQKADSGQ
jgi:pimeloyl-ACP methyl ester carboxylesterase